MNSVNSKSCIFAAAALVTGVAIGAAAYYNRDTIAELGECAMYDKSKADNLHKLRKIQNALRTYESELKSAEESANVSTLKGESISPATKNVICGLSTGFDFILISLDKVEGDSMVKKERKRLVDEFKSYSQRVDALSDLVN